jgi:opacity protein-like surface antigen
MQSYSDNVVANEAGGVENSSVSGTLLGWTVGAGVEHALTNHWSIRIGFLHTEFGRLSAFGFCMMAFRLIFRTLPTMLAI